MIASPPLKNQDLQQPSIFDLPQAPDTTAETGFLSQAEDILLEQYVTATDTSAGATRKNIANIYILMVVKKGDRESAKYGSFNKLCESRAQVWGFSVSQCYRIGQASQKRETIRKHAVAESWEIGDVDDIADSVLLEMERVENGFEREVLEHAYSIGDKGITSKSLEEAAEEISGRPENADRVIFAPKTKKGQSGGSGSGGKLAEVQDLLIKERQRRVELEEKLAALTGQAQDDRVAELEANYELLLKELDALRASSPTQINSDELDSLVNQRIQSIRLEVEAEIRQDLQAQLQEAESLRIRVAQLEEQLSKVAIDAPMQELIPVVEEPQVEQFWRRKENLLPVSNEGRLKSGEADTAYIRCDTRSAEEQIQLSLDCQVKLEGRLDDNYTAQRRHSPTSPMWAMHQPLIDEIQERIAFEQQLRADLGYQEPVSVSVPPVTEEIEEVAEVVEDEDAYILITEDDAHEINQFCKANGISAKEFIDKCLTPRRYQRASFLTKAQLKEVWVEIQNLSQLKFVNEDEQQDLLAFVSESGISNEDLESILDRYSCQHVSQIMRCQLSEVRQAVEDIIEF